MCVSYIVPLMGMKCVGYSLLPLFLSFSYAKDETDISCRSKPVSILSNQVFKHRIRASRSELDSIIAPSHSRCLKDSCLSPLRD